MAFTKKNYIDLTGLSTFKSSLLGTVINDTNKTTTSKTATIKAITDYVDSEVGDLSSAVTEELANKVSSVTYDSTNKKIVYNKGGSTNTDVVTVATIKSAIGNFVKSGSGASAGLVPAPSTTAGTSKYLREDGTWATPPDTTYSVFGKSGSTASTGLVPKPSTTAGTSKYLREDGTWATPPDTNTTYVNATPSSAGLMGADDKAKLDGIAANANNYSHPTYTSKTSGLYKITVDGTGHVSGTTAVTKDDITGLGIPGSDTNTHYTAIPVLGASTAVANATSSVSNPYLNIVENSAKSGGIQIKGGGATSVSAINGVITISSTDNNTTNVSATTSGSGNAVTAVTASGSSITVTKGATFLTAHQDISGKEDKSNKVTSWSSTTTDTHYPSEKLVKSALDGKAASSHTHTKAQITDFPTSLPASDVYSWAKAKTKPSYTWDEISSKPTSFSPSSHTHTKAQITDFPTSMPASDVYAWAKASAKPSYTWDEISSKPSTFTPASHDHNYAGSASAGGPATSANWLNTNDSLTYGASGLQYFNHNTSITSGANKNVNPTNDWYHIIRLNHANKGGYFADIAVGFHNNYLGYRRIANGTESGWFQCLDSSNYTSYVPTKTGSGASGTWGISITGSSASATKATQDGNGNTITTTYGNRGVANTWSAVNTFTNGANVTSGSSSASGAIIASNGGIWAAGGVRGNKVYNAVWNDLADCIPVDDDCELTPGYCYCFDGEKYYKSSKYLDDGIIGIHSDTYGMHMGYKDNCKQMDVAVAGFVLAYVDKEYPVGTPLTCTENGYLTRIEKSDKMEYPEKIVATYWKNEPSEYWGGEKDKIKVNGRKWVKIK